MQRGESRFTQDFCTLGKKKKDEMLFFLHMIVEFSFGVVKGEF